MFKQMTVEHDNKKYTFTQLHQESLAHCRKELGNYINMTQEEKTYLFIELAFKSLLIEHNDINVETTVKILGEDTERAQKIVDFVFDFSLIVVN